MIKYYNYSKKNYYLSNYTKFLKKTSFGFSNLTPVIKINKKDNNMTLAKISCIYDLLYFSKGINKIQALINLNNKVNAITPVYILKLGLKIYGININAQINDSFILKMFEIVLASFQVRDKLRKAEFFQETFLLAAINIKMVLDIFFLVK